ncbi:thioesterase family protein [Pseudomonas sp. PDM09]|uniref:thioesterase family protein n=1 Tax=Pseudomonas sp. PDM09 TaxID=2769270 RepID=UPI00177F0F26|nr:thioesterase family protein [Pseudomonas sp. PDM09]MBD9562273.1 thioesterase family protein [Pseudomonas sp. PDM09]
MAEDVNGKRRVLPPLPTVAPIEALQSEVGETFIDANGHMGAANYILVFQQGLPKLFRPLGFGPAYRARGLTCFQREAHITHERELLLGDPITLYSWLIGFDERCFHHYHEMRRGPDGPLVATIEYLTVSVDLATRRSAPFPEDVRERLHTLMQVFAKVECPGQTGRKIALRTKQPRSAH